MSVCSVSKRCMSLLPSLRHQPLPTLDFLAPCLVSIRQQQQRLRFSTSLSRLADTAENASKLSQTSDKPMLSEDQHKFLNGALRVNQAGELAATIIYTAQTTPIVRAYPHLRPLMKHMYDQEAGHFKTFNELLAKHRIRPTAMYPIWKVAATALGWTTAVMGREAAMACTEAVETEIGQHYNDQVKSLLEWDKQMEESGKPVPVEMKDLIETIRKIRDEELEHLDHAVEHDSKEAKPYDLLTNVIRGGCRGAIWISERV